MMPTRTLLGIPNELLTPIFSYACADGGKTGATLSLVCREIRDICKSTGADITTAVLCGEKQLKRFLFMLRRRPYYARKVRSLFLYPTPQPLDDPTGDVRCKDNRKAVSYMLAILKTITAYHLVTLSININTGRLPHPLVPLVPFQFPSLRELSISGPLSEDSFQQSLIAPRLERLRIMDYDSVPPDFGEHLTRLFPRLTHLRIDTPSETGNSPALPRFLHAYCKLQRPSAEVPPSPPVPRAGHFAGLWGWPNLQLQLPATTVAEDLAVESASISTSRPRPKPVPPSLHRIVIAFRPSVLNAADGTVLYQRYASVHRRIYKKIASEQNFYTIAHREDEVDKRKKSMLIILPDSELYADPMNLNRRAFWIFSQDFKHWEERANGTGKGCWV
ncbi:hypothetical protein EIP91_001831 [Steccherinum ochraceum]|uniref:F-box domain-containing protein n=1 Tax=Steccherinum ochraceum TaxID=92696 RepID=A0A4R0RH04_9APHY|nr:hypothetical protein EIP91_001831 [Steccherinum ochraceum]